VGIFDMFRPADKPIENGVPGSAQVVSVSSYNGRGVYQQCHMNLVISAPNITPTAVEFSGLVHSQLWPRPGSMLPITVDPTNPSRYSILWRDIPDNRTVARSDAEGIAAALQGDPSSLGKLVGGGLLGGANVQVVGDVSHLTEDQKAKLRMFGIDPDALIAAAKNGSNVGANFTTIDATGTDLGATIANAFGASAAAADDSVSKLERLAALKDRGVITDAEFDQEKKKILG
jgi:hypothetical protein